MAFFPGKPAHLTGPQHKLVVELSSDLALWKSDVPHKERKPFLFPNELTLYRAIREYHPFKIVLAQVQLIRLVNVDCDAIKADWLNQGSPLYSQPKFGKLIDDVKLLSLDFVICNSSGTPGLVIELDGDEHLVDEKKIEEWVVDSSSAPNWNGFALKEMPEAIEGWYRDRIKEHAIRSAGINFVRFQNSKLQDYDAMRQLQEKITRSVV